MGNALNTGVNNVSQTSKNQIFQSANNVCKGVCHAVNENVNVIISGSHVGNVHITSRCTADALCTMRSSLDAISTQMLDARQYAQARDTGSSPFGISAFSVNTTVNNIKQTLENSYTQMISNVCSADASSINKNITVDISNATVADVDIGAEASASASCSINNSVSAYVSQSEVSKQTAISSSGSAFIWVVLIVAIAAVIIAVAIVGVYGSTTAFKARERASVEQSKVQVAALEAIGKKRENSTGTLPSRSPETMALPPPTKKALVSTAPKKAPVSAVPKKAPVITEAPVTTVPSGAPVSAAPKRAPVSSAPKKAPAPTISTKTPVITEEPAAAVPKKAPVSTAPTNTPVSAAPKKAPVGRLDRIKGLAKEAADLGGTAASAYYAESNPQLSQLAASVAQNAV